MRSKRPENDHFFERQGSDDTRPLPASGFLDLQGSQLEGGRRGDIGFGGCLRRFHFFFRLFGHWSGEAETSGLIRIFWAGGGRGWGWQGVFAVLPGKEQKQEESQQTGGYPDKTPLAFFFDYEAARIGNILFVLSARMAEQAVAAAQRCCWLACGVWTASLAKLPQPLPTLFSPQRVPARRWRSPPSPGTEQMRDPSAPRRGASSPAAAVYLPGLKNRPAHPPGPFFLSRRWYRPVAGRESGPQKYVFP